ncbi:M23 family metallopeptidase [Corynebacterium mastitidis]
MAIGVVVMIVLLLLTVLGDDPRDECVDGIRGRGGEGGVPEGEFSLPQKAAMSHVTSGWRVPGRPDHQGVDIAQGQGTAIYAFADGVVAAAGEASGFGQWIVLNHDDGGQTFSTVYGHMFPQDVLVAPGDRVKAGQHIANEGYNGAVSPPGPGGSHLHFEVWQPSRLDGGHDVDPMPWLNKAVEPGTKDASDPRDRGGGSQGPSAQPMPERRSGGVLPSSEKIANEEHLQIDAIRVARSVAQRFPEIDTIGGWRPFDPFPDHPSGRAVDVMIPDWEGDHGRVLGDEIRDYLYANREDFHIEYMIWRQEYIPSQGAGSVMEDRGSPTQNHFDHVHVTTVGGGMPGPDHEFAPAPDGGSVSPRVGSDCGGAGITPDEGVGYRADPG